MKAVVLAGGLGTRLGDAIEGMPKAMADIGGRPFLAHLVDWLRAAGFADLVLAIGYGADAIVEHFGDGSGYGVRIEYSRENEPLGTGGALGLAASRWESTALVLNGDVATDVDPRRLCEFHTRVGAAITLACIPVDDAGDYGAVDLRDDGYINGFREKGVTRGPALVNAGIYAVERSALEGLPFGPRYSLETDLFPHLAARGRLWGIAAGTFLLDIGRPERLAKARERASMLFAGPHG